MAPEVDIVSLIWTDHAPVYFSINFPDAPKWFSSWKLNNNLLKDQICLGNLRIFIQSFLEIHANYPTPLPIQWEALKCIQTGANDQILTLAFQHI